MGPLNTVYAWDPVTYYDGQDSDFLGVEAPLWTEKVNSENGINQMSFPKVAMVAETGWTKKKGDYNAFNTRFQNHHKRLELLCVAFGSTQAKCTGPDPGDAVCTGEGGGGNEAGGGGGNEAGGGPETPGGSESSKGLSKLVIV